MVHVVDEETGSVKGCVRAAEELDKTKKSQMVRVLPYMSHRTGLCDSGVPIA